MDVLRIIAIVFYTSPAISAAYLNSYASLPLFGIELSSRFLLFSIWTLGNILLCISTFRFAKHPIARIVSGLILAFGLILNYALAFSLYLQGAGFNDRFIWHLNIENLDVAFTAFRPILFIFITGFFALIVLLCQPNRPHSAGIHLHAVAGTLAGLLLLIPVHSAASFVMQIDEGMPFSENSYRNEIIILDWSNISNIKSSLKAKELPNIIIIFLESVEVGYFDEKKFPDLLINLQTLKDESRFFKNRVPVPGATFTAGSIASSLCGVPPIVGGDGNKIFESHGDIYLNILCLPEILGAIGYRTAYYGGADLDFGGKRSFLLSNGVQTAAGRFELAPKLGLNSTQLTWWGLFDSDLLEYGAKIAKEMAEDPSPFMLTLLTLDTHHPDGVTSPPCQPYARDDNTMLNAVHCTDQLIASLVSQLRSINDDRPTQIVILNDHLAMRNVVIDRLSEDKRSSFMMFLDTGYEPVVFEEPYSAFDFAPTVLSFLGAQGVRMGLGRDVSDGAPGLVPKLGISNSDIRAIRFSNTEGPSALAQGVAVDEISNLFYVGNHPTKTVRDYAPSNVYSVTFSPGRKFETETFAYLPYEHGSIISKDQEKLGFFYVKNETCVRKNFCPTPPYLFFGFPEQGPYILREGPGNLQISGSEIAEYLTDYPPPGFTPEEIEEAVKLIGPDG